ncbi:hypothetical protein QUB13_09160 [Microcoleus sp. B4-D4]
MTKIEKNTKGVAVFDCTQWVLADMSSALLVHLSQPVAAALSVSKTIQTPQPNSNEAAHKVFKEGIQLYWQETVES